MVRVQNFFSRFQIQMVLGVFVPGQRYHPVEVGQRHGVFRRRRVHPGEALELPVRLFLRFLGQVFFLDFGPVFLHFAAGFVNFAQFLLNGLELLAEVVLPLVLLHVPLDLGLDFVADLQDLDLVVDQLGHLFEALLYIHNLEDFLFFGCIGIDRGGDHVGQDAGVL